MHAQETIHVEKPTAADYSTGEVQKLLTERSDAKLAVPASRRFVG